MVGTEILGYCDPISAEPGETVRFMVSCDAVESYRADIVRLICADSRPEGPGFKEELIPSPVNGEYPGRKQAVYAGSCIVVPTSHLFDELDSFSLQAMIWPTTPTEGRQALITRWMDQDKSGFGLFIDEDGSCSLLLGDGRGGVERISTGKKLVKRYWYFVRATYDAASHTATVRQEPREEHPGVDDSGEASKTVGLERIGGQGLPVVIAACIGNTSGGRQVMTAHYNGKIDSPRLARRILAPAEREALKHPQVPSQLLSAVVSAWDFSREISSTRAMDASPNALHGELVNFPARAMTGYHWTAEVMCWRDAPEQYGAIHFHDDDICDFEWEPSLTLDVPSDMRSGIYAARLTSGEAEAYIPFFVRPPRGSTTAKLALLVPTANYMAYANYIAWADMQVAQALFSRMFIADEVDLFVQKNREYGVSTYDRHRDGSGVCYGSSLRPMLTFVGPKREFLWNLNADSHITDWLEAKGIAYDVITDDDLHREGLALLSPYNAVITGTHPEYYSVEMLDALEGYTHGGGRLFYTGGNGFYWRISYHPSKRGIMEVRRGHGTRTWVVQPGEQYHSFDGAFGGLWREQGRAPNRLVGTGFTSEGLDRSSYYRRQAGSFDPRAAFIFQGVGADELIGNFGSNGDGAAGIEIDRVDPGLGTPPHTLVLASSEEHSDSYLLVVEDVHLSYLGQGGTENLLVHADMVFFETPNGGAVFSTSSIAWAAALSHNGYDNNVSRITENVLRRFLDDKPF